MKTLLHTASDVDAINTLASVDTELSMLTAESTQTELAMSILDKVRTSIEAFGMSEQIKAFVGSDYDNMLVEGRNFSDLTAEEATEGAMEIIATTAKRVWAIIRNVLDKVVQFIKSSWFKIRSNEKKLRELSKKKLVSSSKWTVMSITKAQYDTLTSANTSENITSSAGMLGVGGNINSIGTLTGVIEGNPNGSIKPAIHTTSNHLTANGWKDPEEYIAAMVSLADLRKKTLSDIDKHINDLWKTAKSVSIKDEASMSKGIDDIQNKLKSVNTPAGINKTIRTTLQLSNMINYNIVDTCINTGIAVANKYLTPDKPTTK